MEKIVFEFTKEEYRDLLDIVSAGNMMLCGAVEKDEEKYNKIESKIFSKTKEINKSEYAVYDKEYGGYLPSDEFYKSNIQERMEAYDTHTFWAELVHRLALRDVAENLKIDNPDILIEALIDRTDEYEDFFETHDISDIVVKGMKPISQNPETFRSMNLGDVELPETDDMDIDECDCDDDCDCHHHH